MIERARDTIKKTTRKMCGLKKLMLLYLQCWGGKTDMQTERKTDGQRPERLTEKQSDTSKRTE